MMTRMKSRLLTKNFFNRHALAVAKGLLGKHLIRQLGKRRVAVMITEVEAYIGPHDKACHASRGRTPRTEAMFGEPGTFYVYFTYGMHWMLNIVTDKKNYPAAVLIRGAIFVNENGEPRPRSRRAAFLSGPARLTKFLKIDKRFNGQPASGKSGLWLEEPSHPHTRTGRVGRKKIYAPFGVGAKIKRGPRVGVDYAGKWAKKLYNFKLIHKALP